MRAKIIISFGLLLGLIELANTAVISLEAEKEKNIKANRDVCVYEEIKSESDEMAAFKQVERTDRNTYLLAKLAMAEAEGEDTEGKALVVRVVLNRVDDNSFPNTVEEVINQPKQFSPIENGRFDAAEPNEDCWRAVEDVLSGWNESKGATYFESPSNSNWHSEHLKFLFRHGNHYFYKEAADEEID